MRNPLNRFGNHKAAVEAVVADAKAKKPMITGGLAMTLKSLGINPEMVDETARELITAIADCGDRLARIEQQNDHILAQNSRILELLENRQSPSETEGA